MRIRVRGPEGQSTIDLPDTATVGELLSQISRLTSIERPEIKYGYPPKALSLDGFEPSAALSDAQVLVDGEQLTVSEKFVEPVEGGYKVVDEASNAAATPNKPHTKPLSLSRKAPTTEPPELPLPSHASVLLLRIMPDDNSCLFRAFGSAFFGLMDNMIELRSIIAQTIQANPTTYPAVVLEKAPDTYCRWIQTEAAWGGAIELDILSKHFDVEICSIDVQTLRADRFNEGRPKRCILVYSGIHYDTIALSPADPPYDHSLAPPDFDTKIFDTTDEAVLQKAIELCRILQARHYFTDTSKFSIRCNICMKTFIGERGATDHANDTGHYDFGEAG